MQTEPNDIWTPELAEVSNENALCEFYSLAVGSSRRKRKPRHLQDKSSEGSEKF